MLRNSIMTILPAEKLLVTVTVTGPVPGERARSQDDSSGSPVTVA